MDRIIDYENLSDKIKEWILSYTVNNKITTLVIGVSGGTASFSNYLSKNTGDPIPCRNLLR